MGKPVVTLDIDLRQVQTLRVGEAWSFPASVASIKVYVVIGEGTATETVVPIVVVNDRADEDHLTIRLEDHLAKAHDTA